MTGAVLEASELTVRRMGRTILRDVSLALSPGQLVQITGANGAGKTSLLRVLSSLLTPVTGRLTWHGRAVRAGDAEYGAQLAYVGHANGLDADLSTAENLRFIARMAARQPDADTLRLALDQFGLGAVANVPVRTLSQGQRRRVSLARLALVPRSLWLLDEPLTSLDHAACGQFHAVLDAHLTSGGMAVIATHQLLTMRTACAGAVLQLPGPTARPTC